MHPDTTRLFKTTIVADKDPSHDTEMIALGHEMTAGKEGTMHVTMNGRLCHVAYKPVPGTSWSLALVCPDSEVLTSYNMLAYIVGLMIIIGLL